MNEKEMKKQVLEAITRLENKKPSEWNAALILQVKTWLFPKIKAVIAEKNAEGKDFYEDAVKIFENDEK